MDNRKFTERLMSMDDQTWARHANPWSGWTRVPILPLLALAVWSRVWLGWYVLIPIAALVVWTWLNPRVFGPPKHLDAWMSRGVMGERMWLARKEVPIPPHHAQMAFVLNLAAGGGVVVFAWGLWQLDLGLTLAGLVGAMGAKLWFLDRMVWLYDDTNR
ncbi:hypothetical protein ACMU_10315 [Actibacterium mucosum KCTC 23349]|uniref:Uncharacterized protein n=1 Tax=Actibacterium mucosum KCTC 23349 TaxID=1454373 RepID=A0A037ZI64_9RHOB|nr:DUF6653 family protein [Actibacterium mucosum]KAJ56140.1 hypothetical protein ACMU_10315 [Actibacterium mucosum KCTC 23349]